MQYIRGHILARNSILNLIGQGAPFIVAIFALPPIIKGLGTERFGVLTLAWMVVGYFSLFDLGIGKALTKLVAEKIGKGNNIEVPALVWTALALMGGMGLAGAALLALLSSWLVYEVLRIPSSLQLETLNSFYLLSIAIPIVIVSAGFRGLLEAYQRFGLINAVRIPMGIFTFLGPVAVLHYSNSLFPVVAVLVVGRLFAWGAHLSLCLKTVPALRHCIRIDRKMVRPLLSFGGWLTVSSIVGPIILYLDRFLIASYLSVAAVAYYTTPYEIVTKLYIIPTALLSVMFPAFTVTFSQNTKHVILLYQKTRKYVLFAMAPIVLLICFFAKDALAFWLNVEFAVNSYRVTQLLVVGVFINTLGLVSQSLVQASGRPDLTAKLHLVELPLYLSYLYIFINAYGIIGAAIAWLIRVSISSLVLNQFARWSILKHSVKTQVAGIHRCL
jgi:O-antigen/teichoic acid export membrane protein